MSFEQITANPKVCQELVDLGIKPRAFLWHISDLHPTKLTPSGDKMLVWETFELENPKFIPGGVVPAWTMEELNVMIGGDDPKPDLAPESDVIVRTDTATKTTYFDYTFGIFELSTVRIWKRGSQASAEILADLLKRGIIKPEKVNSRYDFFFKH